MLNRIYVRVFLTSVYRRNSVSVPDRMRRYSHYSQMKLVGKTFCWGEDSHIDYRCWFVLKYLLCTLHAQHSLCSSETNYREPNVEHKPELEKAQLVDLVAECMEILANVGKLLESMVVKVDTDSAPPVLVILRLLKSQSMNQNQSQKCESQNQKWKSLLLRLL